jgi:hypothetical protein
VEGAERLEAETLRTIPAEAERIEKHQFRLILSWPRFSHRRPDGLTR